MHGNTIVLNNIETDQKNKKPSDGKLEVDTFSSFVINNDASFNNYAVTV